MRYHRDSYYNEPYGARYFADRDSPRQGEHHFVLNKCLELN